MRNPLGSTVSTAMHSSSVPRQPPPAATSLPRYYQGRAAAADSFGAAAAAPAGSRRLQAVSEQIGSVSRELTAQQIGAFRQLEALLEETLQQECQDSQHGEVANAQDLERVTNSCAQHLTARSTVLDSAGPEVLLSKFGTITQLGLVFRKRGDRTLMHRIAGKLAVLWRGAVRGRPATTDSSPTTAPTNVRRFFDTADGEVMRTSWFTEQRVANTVSWTMEQVHQGQQGSACSRWRPSRWQPRRRRPPGRSPPSACTTS